MRVCFETVLPHTSLLVSKITFESSLNSDATFFQNVPKSLVLVMISSLYRP